MDVPGPRGRLLAVGGALVLGLTWLTTLGFSQSVISSVGSNSMSHAEHPMPGVFDPGEWRRLSGVDERADVVTFLEGKEIGHRVGAEYGDVLTYKPVHRGEPVDDKRINHRALAWVEYNETADAYDVPALDIHGARTFVVPGVGSYDTDANAYVHRPLVVDLDPRLHGRHDGFITKGDHNPTADQSTVAGLSGIGTVELVTVDRIDGRIVGHVDTHEIRLIQVGVPIGALALSLSAYSARRARTWDLPLLGRRCPECGRSLEEKRRFCPRCGRAMDR